MNFSKACSYTFMSMESYNHVNSVTSFQVKPFTLKILWQQFLPSFPGFPAVIIVEAGVGCAADQDPSPC